MASWPGEPTGGYVLHVAIGSEMPLGARLALWPVYFTTYQQNIPRLRHGSTRRYQVVFP